MHPRIGHVVAGNGRLGQPITPPVGDPPIFRTSGAVGTVISCSDRYRRIGMRVTTRIAIQVVAITID